MKKILIQNAKVVNEGKIEELDVYIEKGKIEKLAASIENVAPDISIDAKGKYLLPGMIDDQVHFREPGLTHKACIASESRAAVAGGITSYMEMPNCIPPTIDQERLDAKLELGGRVSMANFAFYFGATNGNLEAIKKVDPKQVCGLKVFMGSSTGDMLVDQPDVLEAIFANSPTLIVTHCEDTPMILENEKKWIEKYGDEIPFKEHPNIRSAEACYKSSSFAVDLAKRHGSKLHVLHLTTAKEMELFSSLPLSEKNITAEVCAHHLFFDERDYEKLGSLIKCNPAIKRIEDREALHQALIDGKIDVIATDHAPHTLEEKQGNYRQAPAGLPLVQHALLSLLEWVHRGKFKLEMLVEKTSHRVADLFDIHERGYIREGYWADLVLVDMDQKYEVDQEPIYYQCGWTPFQGQVFNSRIEATIVSGQLAFHQGKFDEEVRGKALEFIR